jgi:hypothetical protein
MPQHSRNGLDAFAPLNLDCCPGVPQLLRGHFPSDRPKSLMLDAIGDGYPIEGSALMFEKPDRTVKVHLDALDEFLLDVDLPFPQALSYHSHLRERASPVFDI